MRNQFGATSLGVAVLLAGLGGGAAAHAPSDPQSVGKVAKLSAASSLVAHSKVTRVEYRMSSPGANGSRGIPYTFVTFSILEAMQGSAPAPTITLRFIGGTDGHGGYMDAEGVPWFQPGDEDVLFIAGNGESGCPLVMCEFGRYRVLNDAVYEAHGKPVVSVDAGRIVTAAEDGPDELHVFRFPRPDFDAMLGDPQFAAEIAKSGLSVAEARAQYAARPAAAVEIREVNEARPGQAAKAAAPARTGMQLQSFLASVRGTLAKKTGRAAAPLQSANARGALAVPPVVAAAPAVKGGAGETSPGPTIRKN